MNHAHLGPLFPEWIPPLVVPTNGELRKHPKCFPMQRIMAPTWNDRMSEWDVPFSEHLEIALTTTRQLLELWRKYGIVLGDRHRYNVLVDHRNRVWQIDLDLLYDVVTDTKNVIGPNENLPARKGKYQAKNPDGDFKYQAKVSSIILRQLVEALERSQKPRPFFHNDALYDAIALKKNEWLYQSAQGYSAVKTEPGLLYNLQNFLLKLLSEPGK